ncbi:MAG: RNA polymerase III transcription initiation factor complex subunit [Alectoria sarmentosa]|nr:MAG: RNA polymerase III transcription initiation factor complex subunit [Alectoria sarmentosa]
MATSLDGLIRHLVDQIALCGEHGALPLDFIAHVKAYYANPIDDSHVQNRDEAVPHPGIASNVDRPFLELTWKWLITSPDIRLGSHAGHKQLTLSEVEARNAAIDQSEHTVPISQETEIPEAVTPSHASNALTILQDGDVTHFQRPAETAGGDTNDAVDLEQSNFHPGIRLYASENRMWHALTGHGPDFGKIKSLDFICLSIIASCGPKGILQHDLIRISGQDKRSLPARTDRLHDGGYVEKKRLCVQLVNPKRLLHTSQCILKRFVNNNTDQKKQTNDPGPSPVGKRKRVNIKGQRDQDRQALGQSSSTAAPESVAGNIALSGSRTIPSWTADRSINNQIFELVDRAGIKGMSMTEIRDNLMGDHVRKPLDDYVSRIVDSWQISQPLHLRHLSIVRDTVLKGKTQIYIYYTYENFKKLVEGGTGFWEAVKTVASEVTIGKNVDAALDAKPDVDEYGFPRLEETQFQGRQNDASLDECVSALKVDPLRISATDPVLKKHADGSYGIRPKNAASTPSQATSIKARAIEPQKVALSKPSGAVSTKTKAIEPEKIAAPKPPRDVPVKGRAIGSQTEMRKQVRTSASKPLGRPRKYQKTGIPANFDTMTPDEIDDLLYSQEMFEKYEIVKVEKEIVRRVEDGEDAVVVAYEVLAERDDSRKREGELPLPKTSRAQVLYKFAGEPLPEPDPDKAKSKSRHRKDTRYQPSMAAHTYFVPALRKQAPPELKGKDPERQTPILPTRTRRRGQRVSDLESKMYLPSVAAHSWPYVRPPSSAMEISTTDALQNNIKRKQGRLAKPKQQLDPQFKYLPSITAHSGSFLPPNTSSTARAGQKRKRTANTPLENDEQHTIPLRYQYLPSIAAHSGSFLPLPLDELHVARAGQKRKRAGHMLLQHNEHHRTPKTSSAATQKAFTVHARESSIGISKMQLNAGNEGMYPGWEKFMSKHYQQQLETITKSNAGVFIGKTTPRRKRPCEPRDFRPTHFKLAVFKFARLSELDWSVKKIAASEQISRLASRNRTPTSQVEESALMPYNQSILEGQPDLSRSTSLQSHASSCLASQPISTCVSPYVDTAGTKRKRTTSPPPARGATLFDPFSASPYSRHSSPTTESSKPISKPSTLPEIAVPFPVIDQVHKKSTIEIEAPARTPGKQPDMKESSEVFPNSPVLDDSKITPSEAAPRQVVQPSQSSGRKASKPPNRQSVSKISRRGGSTAMLRKTIIMDIVDKCEGVFPSHKEMSSPFAAEWKRRGQEGTPEAKTISNAVSALIKENKLRQITFTSRTRQGITVTKSMLILPTIETTDPKVKETQTKMVAYHPRYFVPTAVLPPQDYQSTEVRENKFTDEEASEKGTEETVQDSSAIEPAEFRRLDLAKKIMDGKERAAMARLEALNQQDQQGLEHPDGDETYADPFIQQATTDAVKAAAGPAREILPRPTPKRPGGRRGQKRVERLASIRKPVPSRINPLPTIPTNTVSNPSSLIWLPSNYAFSDFNFEEQRPTVLMATSENGVQIGTSEARIPLDSNEQARQRIREMAINAARIERKQALANSTRHSLLYPDLDPGQLQSPYAPIRPPSPSRQAPTSRTATLNTARPRNQPSPYTPPYAGEANPNKTVRPGDDLGPKHIDLEETRQLPPTSNTMRRGSMGTRASPSPESPLSLISGWPVAANAKGLGTSYQRILLVSFMDPVHYLHRATGTFSVTFSGLRPPRKIFAHRGTTLDPYAASLKAVKPYISHRRSTWPPLVQESQKAEKTPFDEEVDGLLRRELEANALDNIVLVGWPFVNHVFSHAHKTVEVVEADMEAAKQVTVSLKDGRLTSRRFPRNKDSRPRIANRIFSTGSRGIDPAPVETRTPLKRRRLTSLLAIGTQDEASGQVDLDQGHRPTKLRRVRGPRQAKSLGENGEERLLTAVMVIRALTGGLDKRIDWVLVAKVFEPTYTQMFVHSRWSSTLQKYKLVLPKMESDFQSIFTSAYEQGTVPAIDFDHLDDYDWKWLVEWTMANVNTPTQSLPELPVERSEFDGLYTLNEPSSNEINEFYEIDGSSVLARRAKIVQRDPYVLPLFRERRGARPEDAEDLTTAKTWIRANIMTPESTYNPSVARAKLSTFPDRTVEDALKQLLIDRVLTQENKGRLIPGRNYDISDFLISRLKKNLQFAHFHRAAVFKQQLDHDFEERGFATYSHAADDGDMIVIVNLQAHQRIKIVPIGVPMNKWGQTDGGYETRQMDKRRLSFSLELRPSPMYIYGNSLPPLPAPPSQHLQDPMAKIPLWYDIHGSLVPVMWEMALAAVVAVLAIRPGVGAWELEKVMRPAMEVWELQEVLEWLVCAKAAKQVGQGFSVEDEWWWLALGTGENSEEWSGEDVGDRKGKGKEGAGEDVEDVITRDLD